MLICNMVDLRWLIATDEDGSIRQSNGKTDIPMFGNCGADGAFCDRCEIVFFGKMGKYELLCSVFCKKFYELCAILVG